MITIANEADIAKLVALINSAYRGESSRAGWTTEVDLMDGVRTYDESIRAMMQRPASCFLKNVDEENNITGCVFLEKKEQATYLGMLTVSPLLQSKGTGKQLLKAAEAWAKENNSPAIEMTVISIRHELVDWYLRHGYEKTGETKPFPVSDHEKPRQPLEFEVMRKEL